MKTKFTALNYARSTVAKKKHYEFDVPDGVNQEHTWDKPLWFRTDGCWHNAFYHDGKLCIQMLHSYHTFREEKP